MCLLLCKAVLHVDCNCWSKATWLSARYWVPVLMAADRCSVAGFPCIQLVWCLCCCCALNVPGAPYDFTRRYRKRLGCC